MPNMTISIPKELYSTIKKHGQVRWSEVARRAMAEYAKKLEILDKLLEKSELTEKDAIEIGAKVKAGIAKRHGI
jgi:predicted CopG family antitoxin